MVTTRFYLDCRDSAPGSPAPLKLVLTRKGVRALLPTNISLLPSQWDARRQIVVGHPRKQQFNSLLAEQKIAVDAILFRLSSAGGLRGLRACDIKRRVLSELHPDEEVAVQRVTFLSRFNSFVARRSPGTQRIYGTTLARMRAYLNDGFDSLTFEDITVQWLRDFDAWLALTSPSRNARNIHFRNIRAIFNDALDDEVISCYPFRKFKIIPEKTRKRALTVEQLRSLFSVSASSPSEQRYFDCFKLIFMLCGINIVDLCALTSVTAAGRVEYSRAKTHRLYSVKVEPEALALIEKYRGQSLLLNYADTCSDYRFFYRHLCEVLRSVGRSLSLPGLSSYWARHSWATIAASLDIPKETIAAALGHGGNSVTDIYIDFDRSKVDAANRRVLDWVLYGKKE